MSIWYKSSASRQSVFSVAEKMPGSSRFSQSLAELQDKAGSNRAAITVSRRAAVMSYW
jgi:hypothetical protein